MHEYSSRSNANQVIYPQPWEEESSKTEIKSPQLDSTTKKMSPDDEDDGLGEKSGNNSQLAKNVVNQNVINLGEENNNFNPETATQRLQGTENVKEFPMVNSKGHPIRYGLNEIIRGNKGQVYLPEGTLVSKLETNPSDPDYVHVIAWHNMKYREGYVSKMAFAGKYEGGSQFDVEVFIDDAYHTVHRAELLLGSKPENDKSVEHLRVMLLNTKNDLDSYKKGKLQITREMLDKIKQNDTIGLKINVQDKPETLNRISNEISKSTNPVTSDHVKLSDTVLFIPLTDTWFQTDEKLKEHYDSVMMKNGNFNRIGGDTGEGIEGGSDIKEWFDEFEVLRKIIKDRPAANSPEGKWLNTINADMQKGIKRMIFIGGDTWNNMAENKSKYSSFVSVNTSFGPLQANPMMLLLMHELNVNTNNPNVNLMGEDTHIAPDDTKAAWESAKRGEFSKKVSKDSDQLDDLFQSQSGIALTILSRYMGKIKEMQTTVKKQE